MPFVVGVVLAFGAAGAAALVGLDRDRGFYPTVLIVIGATYVLFAAMAGDMRVLVVEAAGFVVFFLLATAGFRWSPWLLAAGLAAHGLFDFAHPHLWSNPGVPVWWPSFCAAYDLAAAGCLAWRLAPAGGAILGRTPSR